MGEESRSRVASEPGPNSPFDIPRVYDICDNIKGVDRGYHAHINLKQIAIAISGSCTFVIDDGEKREEVLLDNPTKGLFIEGLTWREMKNFSENCVLIVLASEPYDENDYIRDYEHFLRISNEK